MKTPEKPLLLEELATAGAAYTQAKEHLKDLRAQRALLVAQGFAQNLSATELARTSGVSRQRLYLLRDLGAKELKDIVPVPDIQTGELIRSLDAAAAQLPAAEEAASTALAESERLLALVADEGGISVKELARLAGVTPEQTRRVRLRAGVAPRRYSSSA